MAGHPWEEDAYEWVSSDRDLVSVDHRGVPSETVPTEGSASRLAHYVLGSPNRHCGNMHLQNDHRERHSQDWESVRTSGMQSGPVGTVVMDRTLVQGPLGRSVSDLTADTQKTRLSCPVAHRAHTGHSGCREDLVSSRSDYDSHRLASSSRVLCHPVTRDVGAASFSKVTEGTLATRQLGTSTENVGLDVAIGGWTWTRAVL